MLITDLDTPSLIVDLRRLEANLDQFQQIADRNGVSLRPHTKTHKSVAVAREQQEGGVTGITVAKPSEASVFAKAGFRDIRIAYPVIGKHKWERIAGLIREGIRISFCVDTIEGANAASSFFKEEGLTAEVLVEVNTGHHRTGITWDHPDAVGIVRQISENDGISVVGLLTHGGQGYHGPKEGESLRDARVRAMTEERDRILTLANRLHDADVLDASAEISVGSTPTISVFENRQEGPFRVTEIRPGNYVFRDAQQVALGTTPLSQCALTVLTQVISVQPQTDGTTRLFVDAGKKVLTSDKGYNIIGHGTLLYDPLRMTALPHATIHSLSEEHGWISVPGASTLEVGDRVRIVPNHACVVVATASELHIADGEEIVATWKVDAHGEVR